jgi:hypothetical protein
MLATGMRAIVAHSLSEGFEPVGGRDDAAPQRRWLVGVLTGWLLLHA